MEMSRDCCGKGRKRVTGREMTYSACRRGLNILENALRSNARGQRVLWIDIVRRG